MGLYSPEPPRRNLIVHHTFNDVEIDRVVDHSPQAIDGTVVGDVTFDHVGTVGSSARMKSNESDVEINAVADQMPVDELHATSWGKSERGVEATALNIYSAIVIGGTEYTLSHSSNEETTAWQYASISFDGTTATLRYAHKGDETPKVVDEVDAVGEVTDFELTFYTNGYGWVDDVRVYRTSLTKGQDHDIFSIGSEHQQTDNYGDAWDNPGIPYIRTKGNANLASALGEEDDYVLRQLDAILDARHIKQAAGGQLDRIGQLADIPRNENEEDSHYRSRIIATMAAARSRGTYDDLVGTIATILDTERDRVELEKAWIAEPTGGIATVEVLVRSVDLDNSELTTSELATIMEDAVAAGHDIEITETSANPFTLIDDADVNDPDLGLTSDSTTDGGGLVSDV